MDDVDLENYCELLDEQGEGLPFYTPQVAVEEYNN